MISKLVATINDKTVEAQIKSKEEAKEKYDDAIAAGNSAVYADQAETISRKEVSLLLGNLPSGQKAVIDLQMVLPLKIVQGAYEYNIPEAFLPNYSKHKAVNEKADGGVPEYTF